MPTFDSFAEQPDAAIQFAEQELDDLESDAEQPEVDDDEYQEDPSVLISRVEGLTEFDLSHMEFPEADTQGPEDMPQIMPMLQENNLSPHGAHTQNNEPAVRTMPGTYMEQEMSHNHMYTPSTRSQRELLLNTPNDTLGYLLETSRNEDAKRRKQTPV